MASEGLFYDSARCGTPEIQELREVWRYRALLVQLVRRDIVTRYKRSLLGVAWTMLNPLGMMIVLTLVFSQLFHSIHGYPAYVLSGLVVWSLFSYSTTTAMNNLLWGGTLLSRIYMPPTSFALSAIGTGLVNLVMSLVPLLLVMLFTGVSIRATVVSLPIPIVLLAIFALGVGLLLSSLAIFFYDVAEMYTILMSAWFYVTPILYPDSMLLESRRSWLVWLNPMYYFVRLFRLPLYDGRWPGWHETWPALLLALASLGLGWSVYTRKSREFAYRV